MQQRLIPSNTGINSRSLMREYASWIYRIARYTIAACAAVRKGEYRFTKRIMNVIRWDETVAWKEKGTQSAMRLAKARRDDNLPEPRKQ